MKKAIALISFLSLSIAWTIGLIVFALIQVIENGKTDDFGVIIFWSGFFGLIAWIVFVRIPLERIDHSRRIFTFPVFPLITSIYGLLVFILLIGWLFINTEFTIVFIIAAAIGFAFGVSYLAMIKSESLVKYFCSKENYRLLVLLYPVIFSIIFFLLFPKSFPNLAFRFMPDNIQHKIIAKTIPKFKVGDKFSELDKALPGYFQGIKSGNGNTAATLEDFAFVVQVNCNKIIRLEYSYDRNTPLTIYGMLNEKKPCP